MVTLLCACKQAAISEATVPQELSLSIGTKSTDPFDNTVWQCVTGERYNRYLHFHDGIVSLFYGAVWEGDLERCSEDYDGSYTIQGDCLLCSLAYPNYGGQLLIRTLDCLKVNGSFSLSSDIGIYDYYGRYTPDMDRIWISIIADIKPWL